MKRIFSIIAASMLMLGISGAASAQELTKTYPNVFVGVQGGGQFVSNGYNVKDVLKPTASVYVGAMWNSILGTRLHINGWEAKEGVRNLCTAYSFKYATATIDLMVNLSNAWTGKDNNPLDFYFIAGIGANKVWGNNYPEQELKSEVLNHVAHACKLGLMLDWNVANNLSLNIEADAVHYGNHDYAHEVNMSKDWQILAQVGLKYTFGKKAKKPAPVVEPVFATRVDTTWYEETLYKEVPVQEEIRRDIHWGIRASSPVDEAKVQEIAQFVKTHKDAKVTVTGYADKGTGNPRINVKYSKNRANSVADALRAAGVPADIMTVEWKGDTEQPFTVNDENRVAITVASGVGTKKEPYKAKKFRTKEVRYQVQ